MAAGLLLGPWIFDANGNGAPFVGGLLTTYINGTTTPQATYTTAALSTPLANPIVADGNGRFPDIWADTTKTFSIKWTQPDGTLISTYNDRIPLGASDSATFALATLTNVTASDMMTALGRANAYTSFINRVVNGDCRIDQRLAGAGAALTAAAGAYGMDRFKGRRGASQTATLQQSTGGPTVFGPTGTSYCAKFTTGTGAAPGVADQVYIEHDIEGNNLYDALLGQSGARRLAIRFWALCSIAGKQSFAIQNSAQDRSNVSNYTISSAGSWQEFTFNIAGDQTGTWLATSGLGLRLIWDCGSGSNYEGAAGAWAAADRRRTSDSVKVGSTSSAYLAISGIQVVVVDDASISPPFCARAYPQELALCQRYAWNPTALPLGLTATASSAGGGIRWPVTMRTAPTIGTITLAAGTGSAGTGNALSTSTEGTVIYNGAANWTLGTNVTASFLADADY